MTFEEYAIKNLHEMKAREPTSQNMRDVALLEIWLSMNSVPNQVEHLAEAVTQDKPILPAFEKYVEVKRKYQTNDTTKDKVLETLSAVLREIKEFLKMLYRNTDMPEEREKINALINDINVGNI